MVLTSTKQLDAGAPWPIEGEQSRLDKYCRNALLFEGKHGQVWPELNPLIQGLPGVSKEKSFDLGDIYDRGHVDMCVNWFKRDATLFADLLCGEPFKVKATEQATADRIIKDNALVLKTHDLVMDLCRCGTGVYKARFDQRGIIEIINPRFWFPVVSPDNATEIIAHILAWSFKDGEDEYVRAEIHEKGKITNKLFRVVGGKLQAELLTKFQRYSNIKETVETGVPEFLVVAVQNVLSADGVFGMDDYTDMNDLVKELEKRLIQASRIFTKFAEPAISGPSSKIDIDPYSGEAVMVGGGLYYGYNANEPKPEYMVWDAQLDKSFTQMDQVIDKLYMVTEISPAAVGNLKQGLAESGSALKRLMMPTLAKTNRLRLRVDPATNDILRITAALEVANRGKGATELTNVQITFADGLPRDDTEIVNNETKRKMSNLTTTASSLKRLDPEMSDKDIAADVKTIQDEAAKSFGM
jgi:hypothetical protein